MTSITLTGTNHAEDQPVHLRVVKTMSYMDALEDLPTSIGAGASAVAEVVGDAQEAQQIVEKERHTRKNHVRVNVEEYAGLLGRACPAGVYEYVEVCHSVYFIARF